MAVGPRWHSVYEMACNVVTIFIEGKEVHAVPQGGTAERERAALANTGSLTEGETGLIHALIHQHEPAYIEKMSALLLAGKSPRRIIDAIQLAAAKSYWRQWGRTPSRCPSTPTSTATPSAGSTTISSTRSGSKLLTWRLMVDQAAWTQRSSRLAQIDPIDAPAAPTA